MNQQTIQTNNSINRQDESNFQHTQTHTHRQHNTNCQQQKSISLHLQSHRESNWMNCNLLRSISHIFPIFCPIYYFYYFLQFLSVRLTYLLTEWVIIIYIRFYIKINYNIKFHFVYNLDSCIPNRLIWVWFWRASIHRWCEASFTEYIPVRIDGPWCRLSSLFTLVDKSRRYRLFSILIDTGFLTFVPPSSNQWKLITIYL